MESDLGSETQILQQFARFIAVLARVSILIEQLTVNRDIDWNGPTANNRPKQEEYG